jgi:hypothetical protein
MEKQSGWQTLDAVNQNSNPAVLFATEEKQLVVAQPPDHVEIHHRHD